MDNQHKKKKPRQRNRPKNKANRLREETEVNKSENSKSDRADQKEATERNESLDISEKSKSDPALEQVTKEVHISDEKISDDKINLPVPTPTSSQNEEYILLIQQLLRAKLLQEKTNSKAAISDRAESNVKKSKSKENVQKTKEDKVALNGDPTKKSNDRMDKSVKKSKSKEKLLETKDDKGNTKEKEPCDHTALRANKSKSKEKLPDSKINNKGFTTDLTTNSSNHAEKQVKKSKSKEKLMDSKVASVAATADRKDANLKQSKSKEKIVDQKGDKQEFNGHLTQAPSDQSELNIKKSKSKEKLIETKIDRGNDAFITNLTEKMENMMANSDNNTQLPQTLIENLQKLFTQEPISDVESSDDEEEYIEYVYKPRHYFLVSLCNFCKSDLRAKELVQCSRCQMTYYCSLEHMKCDDSHRQLCYALRQVADSTGNHLFYKCGDFTTEQFRSYRIVTIRKVEAAINRPLTATEQEVILFPRICAKTNCREYRFDKLADCKNCGQVAFCKTSPEHLNKQHKLWCKPYQLFKELIIFQEKFGHLDPSLPTKILKDLPGACCNTKQIFQKLSLDLQDQCEYAALSQISTCPLTAWYALKLCDQLKKGDVLTIHLIGAEIEFEVDVLHKWELFFLHITPTVKTLNVVFIGPELNPGKISFDQFKKTKCCRSCRKSDRSINYFFESKLYHNYCQMEAFLKPDLVCFFNAGLYRSTGYHLEDTWPETILAASGLKVPIVVTAYTEYETPLDMTRIVQESNRRLNVVLPPIINPFASEKPERNFISDEDAPLMFKNYYCFVVE